MFLFSILLITLLLLGHLWSNNKQLSYDKKAVREQIQILQNSIEQLDNLAYNFKNQREKKNIFNKKKLDRSVTIESIKQHIQKWQQICGINYLSINVGETKPCPGKATLIQNNIHIDISTLRDNNFYQFLLKLENNLPAITIVRRFSLRKLHPVNQKALIGITNGEKVSIFDGVIELTVIHQK